MSSSCSSLVLDTITIHEDENEDEHEKDHIGLDLNPDPYTLYL